MQSVVFGICVKFLTAKNLGGKRPHVPTERSSSAFICSELQVREEETKD